MEREPAVIWAAERSQCGSREKRCAGAGPEGLRMRAAAPCGRDARGAGGGRCRDPCWAGGPEREGAAGARARALSPRLALPVPVSAHTSTHAHPLPCLLPARRPPRRPRSPSRARKGVARRRSGGHVALRRRWRRPRPGLRSGPEDRRWAGGRGRPGRRLLLERRGCRPPAARMDRRGGGRGGGGGGGRPG